MEEGAEAHVAVVAHVCRSAHRTFLCGDDDDTVGTTGTVDGSSRSILQNVDALDVAWANIAELTHEWDTVEHDERVVAGRERTLTTDANLHFLTWLGGSLRHEHTSDTSLQCLSSVGGSNLIQFLTTDVGNGTRHSFAALGTITNHHHFVDVVAVLLHHDVELATCAHAHFSSHIAEVGNFEHSIWLNIQRELSLHVSHCTIRGAFFNNGCTDKRTMRVSYDTRNLFCLLLSTFSVALSSLSQLRTRDSEHGAQSQQQGSLSLT